MCFLFDVLCASGKTLEFSKIFCYVQRKKPDPEKQLLPKLPYKKVNENEVELEKIISGKVTVINYYREIIESYREVIEKLSIVIEKLLRSYRELSRSY